MKASRFSDARKAFIFKQGVDGMVVADICRKAGIIRHRVESAPRFAFGLQGKLLRPRLPPCFVIWNNCGLPLPKSRR